MAKSLDQKDPGLAGVIIGAMLSVVLGAVLAGFHLVFKPVEIVKVPPKDPVAGVRYYVEGGGAAAAGKAWERKTEALATGRGEVGFEEGDLNAWAQGTFKSTPEAEEAKKNATFLLAPGTPNLRLVGNELQLGTVAEFIYFGSVNKLVVQARGGFESTGEGWRYAPKEVYLGCLPVHRIPALLELVAARFGAPGGLPPEVVTVLARATAITVTPEELVVRVP